MLNRSTRYLLAAIQAVIAWEWLVSGINKLLSGTFPQTLADTLSDGIKGNPNGCYVSSLTWTASMPPFSLIIAFANVALISQLGGFTWFNKLRGSDQEVSSSQESDATSAQSAPMPSSTHVSA